MGDKAPKDKNKKTKQGNVKKSAQKAAKIKKQEK